MGRAMRVWMAAGVLAASVGCEAVDSDDVATDGIYAEMLVTASGNGSSQAVAALKVGGANSNTFLDLTERDALIAYAADDSATMARQESLGVISYVAQFPVEAEDTPFKISFLRTHDESEECNGVSAPNSTATLPRPFSITSPGQGATFSRENDDIPLMWDNSGSGDGMRWSATGVCIQSSFSNELSGDPGSYTIPAGALMTTNTAGTCSVTVSLERRRAGSLDPAYGEGGVIHARQVRSVEIESSP